MASGWIKADKAVVAQLLRNKDYLALYMVCLLKGNHPEGESGYKAGEFEVSYYTLANEAQCSVKVVRTFLDKMVKGTFEGISWGTRRAHYRTIINICPSGNCEDLENAKGTNGAQVGAQVGAHITKNNKTITKNKKLSNDNITPISPLEDVLQMFLDYRKEIRKPLKETSISFNRGRLEKLSGGDREKAKAIVERTISHGWTGLYPYEEEREPEKTTTSKYDEIDKTKAEVFRMIEAKYGKTN